MSLWPIGHRDRSVVLYRTCSANIQRRGTILFYWTFQPSIQVQIWLFCLWLYSQEYLAIQPDISGFMATGYIARYSWLSSQIYLAIQPDVTGYLARYNWLYSHLAEEISLLGFVAQLDSQTSYSKLRYIASYLWLDSYWLYNQIYLAKQLAIQLPAIQPDISGYVASSQETPKQSPEPICLVWCGIL